MNEEPRVVGLLINHLDEGIHVLYADGFLLDLREPRTPHDFHPLITQLLPDNQH